MQDLLPKLPLHSVVVMDNATFHKRQDTRDAIQNAGHTLEYLPAYSPDLNPIEHKWAQAKALRKQQNQTVDMLFKSYALGIIINWLDYIAKGKVHKLYESGVKAGVVSTGKESFVVGMMKWFNTTGHF
jgi:hypothetical protein